MVKLMSVENIYNELYPFLIQDWKNTSLLVDKEGTNKTFASVLKSFIQYADQKSKFSLSIEALKYYKEKIVDNNIYEIANNVFLNMVSRYDSLSQTDINIFSTDVLEHLSKKTNYINSLRPQGWEQFILSNQRKHIVLPFYDENTSKLREVIFKGLKFDDEQHAFYDKISLNMTAKNFIEKDIPPYMTLFSAITEYVFQYNKLKNSIKIMKQIDNLLSEGVTERGIKENMQTYMQVEEIKMDFEIVEENEKKKQELNKILNKLSKVK